MSKGNKDARELQRLYGAKYQTCLRLLRTLGFAGAAADLESKGYTMKDEAPPADKAES